MDSSFANNKRTTSSVVSKEIKKVFNTNVSLPDDLVTNEDIRQKFIIHMAKSHIIPKQYLKQIWRLVEQQVIIPVIVKKSGLIGWLTNILRKSSVPFAYSYDDGTMAFYSGSSNRIYILIDNISKSPGNSSDNVAKTVVHELQHMQCHNFTSQFYSVHKNLINDFYFNLFNILCNNQLKVNKNLSDLFGKFLIYMFDDLFSSYDAVITDNDFKVYRDRVASVYMNDKLQVPIFGWQIASALTQCAESIIDGKFFEKASKDSKSAERYLYAAIASTYKKIGMNPMKLKSFFGQECIVPSEIIAMKPAIKMSSDLFALINRL